MVVRRFALTLFVLLSLTLVAGVRPALAVPTNDNQANATLISVPSSTLGDNFGATLEPGENTECDLFTSGSSVWYKLQPPGNGTLTVDTVFSSLDTMIFVYATGPGLVGSGLNILGCSDDSFDPVFGFTIWSRVQVEVQAAWTIYVQVSGVFANQSTFQLNTAFTGPPDPDAHDYTYADVDSYTDANAHTDTDSYCDADSYGDAHSDRVENADG